MTTSNQPDHKRFVSMRVIIMNLFTLSFLLLMVIGYLTFRFLAGPGVMAQARDQVIEVLKEGDNGLSDAEIEALAPDIERAVFTGVTTLGLRNVAILFASLFVMGATLNGAVSTILTGHLKTLKIAADRIAQGEYEQDLSHIYNFPVETELSALARAIEDSGRTHQREEVLKQQVEKLEIHIDQAKRGDEFDDIAKSSWYQDLRAAADQMRAERGED